MSNILQIKQMEEQLALLQIGSIFKDIIPNNTVDRKYLPMDLADVALVMEKELNVIIHKDDSITELRDRAVAAYNKSFGDNTRDIVPGDAFDRAMKGV